MNVMILILAAAALGTLVLHDAEAWLRGESCCDTDECGRDCPNYEPTDAELAQAETGPRLGDYPGDQGNPPRYERGRRDRGA